MHLSKVVIGWLLALNGLIIALFEMVLVYKLEHKRSALYYLTAGSFLIGISFMVLNAGMTVWVALMAILLITLGEMLLFPFMNNFWVSRSNLHSRGQYAAAYTMSFSAAIVLSPTLAAQVANRWGFATLWWLDAILCIFAAAGYYFLKTSFEQHGKFSTNDTNTLG
jgi:predicted MFS family arabinose efflux permease